jgi:Co/Zn/Cd efflux system component
MNISKALLYALGCSVLFTAVHILIERTVIDELLTLTATLAAMIASLVVVYFLLVRNYNDKRIPFTAIFLQFCTVQIFSVILLTLNSAFSPMGAQKPIEPVQVLFSLLMFGLIFPALTTVLVWFTVTRRRNNSIP